MNKSPLITAYQKFIYYRTYSRWQPLKKRRETWEETIDRYMNFMKKKVGNRLDNDTYKKVSRFLYSGSVVPSMRLLQTAGNAVEKCNVPLFNCAYITPQCPKDIADILYIVLSGTGIGFSVENKYVSKFPVVKNLSNKKIFYTIEDSREGWAESLRILLESLFNGVNVEFDYSYIRKKGTPLKTLGGYAAGPEALMKLHKHVRNIMYNNQGKKLRSIDIYDIICFIGYDVIDNALRRTAMISLSDLDDELMMNSKSKDFYINNPQRSVCNNSATYDKFDASLFDKEWSSLIENKSGERGIFSRIDLEKKLPKRRVKVLGDRIKDLGTNPCGEIILQPYQFCNLSEVICRPEDNVFTLMEKLEVATILGTYQSTFDKFNYISPKWSETMKEERLLGVSITGIWDNIHLFDENVLKILKEYVILKNKEYAKKFGINESTATTAIKPSGNTSQIMNCSSGIHPIFSKYYLRRVRISSSDPLFKVIKEQKIPYYPEVGYTYENTPLAVLEFPVKAYSLRCADEVSAIELLELYKNFKVFYTEHNPSTTIYVKNNEWDDVKKWIVDNFNIIGGITFLPYYENCYKLAPYEKIDEEMYKEYLSKQQDINYDLLSRFEGEIHSREFACVGNSCSL